tara:strand:- start:2760 stop:3032 length:273 start_codon:yes stop_codon:yes gene_type:complete
LGSGAAAVAATAATVAVAAASAAAAAAAEAVAAAAGDYICSICTFVAIESWRSRSARKLSPWMVFFPRNGAGDGLVVREEKKRRWQRRFF